MHSTWRDANVLSPALPTAFNLHLVRSNKDTVVRLDAFFPSKLPRRGAFVAGVGHTALLMTETLPLQADKPSRTLGRAGLGDVLDRQVRVFRPLFCRLCPDDFSATRAMEAPRSQAELPPHDKLNTDLLEASASSRFRF